MTDPTVVGLVVFAIIANSVGALERAIQNLGDMRGTFRARQREEAIRRQPGPNRRVDALWDRQKEVKWEIANTRVMLLARAMTRIALAGSSDEAFTRAENRGCRELVERIRRLLFSEIAVVERAADVRREDIISDFNMPERLNPFTAGGPEARGTGAA